MGVPQGKTDSDCVSPLALVNDIMIVLMIYANADFDVIPDNKTSTFFSQPISQCKFQFDILFFDL